MTQEIYQTLPPPLWGGGNTRVSVLLSSTHRRHSLRNSGTFGSRIRLNTEPKVPCSHVIRSQLCRPIQFPCNDTKDHIGLSTQINETSRSHDSILIGIQIRTNISKGSPKAIDSCGACQRTGILILNDNEISIANCIGSICCNTDIIAICNLGYQMSLFLINPACKILNGCRYIVIRQVISSNPNAVSHGHLEATKELVVSIMKYSGSAEEPPL